MRAAPDHNELRGQIARGSPPVSGIFVPCAIPPSADGASRQGRHALAVAGVADGAGGLGDRVDFGRTMEHAVQFREQRPQGRAQILGQARQQFRGQPATRRASQRNLTALQQDKSRESRAITQIGSPRFGGRKFGTRHSQHGLGA